MRLHRRTAEQVDGGNEDDDAWEKKIADFRRFDLDNLEDTSWQHLYQRASENGYMMLGLTMLWLGLMVCRVC